MSTPTKIQSSAVPLTLSTDGINYKNVVCKRSSGFNGTTAVNAEEDDCGIDKGLGTPDWTIDYEGTLNTTPTSSSEVSAKEVLDWWLAKTLLYVKTLTGDGAGKNLYIQGQAYITDVAITGSTGSLVTFTFTLNGVGTPDFSV